MYFVYLLRNRITHSTYIGYTKNLKRRLAEHGIKKYELLYFEAYKKEEDARIRERKLKQRGQTIRRLKERLKQTLA